MARKSTAALMTVQVGPLARPAPPEALPDGAADEWTHIVGSLPPDYFRPADYPLLEAYCRASALHRDACALIDREGLTTERGRAHPAANIIRNCAASMAALATKLRLCPSARYSEKKAETLTRPVAALWERRNGQYDR